MKRLKKYFVRLRALLMPWLEVMVWLAALLLFAFVPPEQTQPTLCVWHHLGVPACPGCGLGHSMADAFRGQFVDSFMHHPLGLFAVGVIVWRIISLVRLNLKIRKTLNQKPYVENL